MENKYNDTDFAYMPLIGVLAGDLYGSTYEPIDHLIRNNKEDFDVRATISDDSVCTLAVAKALMNCKGDYTNLTKETEKQLLRFGHRYPFADYGTLFLAWLTKDHPTPYNSYGNGSAMRVSPVAYVAKDLEECLNLARKVSVCTHNHKEGIKGAQAIAATTFMLIHHYDIKDIKEYINKVFYKIDDNFNKTKLFHEDNATCQGTCPECLSALFNLYDKGYDEIVLNAINLGGDTDTIGAITSGMAQARFGINPYISKLILDKYVDPFQRKVIFDFYEYVKALHLKD